MFVGNKIFQEIIFVSVQFDWYKAAAILNCDAVLVRSKNLQKQLMHLIKMAFISAESLPITFNVSFMTESRSGTVLNV